MNGIANKAKLHSNPIFGAPCGTVVLGICSKSRHAPPIDTKKSPRNSGGNGFKSAAWSLGDLAPRTEPPATRHLPLMT